MSSQILGMGQNPRRDDKNPSQSQPAEIPFTLYNDNLIIVKGTIGTIKGVNLILDTGTTPTSVSKSLASRLKLSGNTESLQTLSGTIETRSLILPHIEVGAFSADQVRVVTQDFKFMEESLGLSIGGILGLDVLRSHNFIIDYKRKKITFAALDTEKRIHFDSQSPLLTVKVNIGDQELRLVVDSGTQGLIAFRNRVNQSRTLRPAQSTFISTVAGTPQAKFFRAVVSLGEDSREQTVTIADVDPAAANNLDGLLGFRAMGFRKVSFDFDKSTLGWDVDASGGSSRWPMPSLSCGRGFVGDDCQLALEAVVQALHPLNPHLAGWRVIVVPENQWQTTSAAFEIQDSVPAFSNLPMTSTYLNAELIFPDRDTDIKLLPLTRLTGTKRLQWVLAHEYGHIVCRTHEEGKAARAGDDLLRGQVGTCN